MSRGGVDRASALFQSYVIGQYADRVAVIQRMLEAQTLKVSTLQAHQRVTEFSSDCLSHGGRELCGHDDGGAADVVDAVVEAGMKRDGQVGRNRPWRGGPYEDRDRSACQFRCPPDELLGALWAERELYIDRRRGVVLVFDLGLSKRCTATQTPMNWLFSLVDRPLLDKAAERPDD